MEQDLIYIWGNPKRGENGDERYDAMVSLSQQLASICIYKELDFLWRIRLVTYVRTRLYMYACMLAAEILIQQYIDNLKS